MTEVVEFSTEISNPLQGVFLDETGQEGDFYFRSGVGFIRRPREIALSKMGEQQKNVVSREWVDLNSVR